MSRADRASLDPYVPNVDDGPSSDDDDESGLDNEDPIKQVLNGALAKYDSQVNAKTAELDCPAAPNCNCPKCIPSVAAAEQAKLVARQKLAAASLALVKCPLLFDFKLAEMEYEEKRRMLLRVQHVKASKLCVALHTAACSSHCCGCLVKRYRHLADVAVKASKRMKPFRVFKMAGDSGGKCTHCAAECKKRFCIVAAPKEEHSNEVQFLLGCLGPDGWKGEEPQVCAPHFVIDSN